ncbi:putative bifunctional diguanylate cyclase/phosphodiesterase [Maricaulis sp. CAU 1757]
MRLLKAFLIAVLVGAGGLAIKPATAFAQTSDAPSDAFSQAIADARASMMGDPVAALGHAEQAEELASSGGAGETYAIELATAWWLQAEALTRLGRPREAHPIAERALAQLGADPTPTKLYADILLALGRTGKLTGDHGEALEQLQRAYDVYRTIGEVRSEAIVLQSIGSIYNDAQQYQRAVEYYVDAAGRYSDPSLDLAAANNLGNAYKELGRYDDALASYLDAREIAAEMGSTMLEARILNNIGSLHASFGRFNAADEAVTEAFEVTGAETTAEWARFLWGVRAQAAHGRGENASAVRHIERTFDGVDLATTPQHFAEFHALAADIYEDLGQYRMATPHLRAFKRLEDEGQSVASSANLALLGAQFDFAEQELQIEALRAEGLEQDLELSRAKARQRLAIAGSLILLCLVGVVAAFWRHRVAQERNKMLSRALYEDAETGLPSRQALEVEIDRTSRTTGRPATVTALEIDRHVHLEGVLGFNSFAELKARMAQRIVADGHASKVMVISRGVLGVVSDAKLDDARAVAECMRKCFVRPITLDGLAIDVAVVAGIAREADAETSVKNAVIAIGQAQEDRAGTAIFDAKRYGDPSKNLSLMSRMLAATENGEMQLHYQPKLNLRTGRFGAAEALCRWRDPREGLLSPNDFIPLAEETGHIRAFTEWALERAVTDQKWLRERGFDLNIAINISGALIADSGFANLALGIASERVGALTFEITETAMMNDPERAMDNLKKWHKAGIKLAIDDYGSGLSSLAYLKTLPSDELKLDRAFVTHVASSTRDRMLVKSTADLAHNLGLEMTAEGVETDEGLALLKLLGCDWAQGYALSRALPVDELAKFLAEMQVHAALDDASRKHGLS